MMAALSGDREWAVACRDALAAAQRELKAQSAKL
jgi:hypothetical protein